MNRLFLILFLALLSLWDGSALAHGRLHHRPRYTAYKHRGDARKRWRRMGVLGRRRYHRRYLRNHPKRGRIQVGRPQGTMPKR